MQKSAGAVILSSFTDGWPQPEYVLHKGSRFCRAPSMLHQEGRLRGLLCVLCRVPVKNPEENNSVVELYVQSVPDNLHTRSLLDLLEQVSSP